MKVQWLLTEDAAKSQVHLAGRAAQPLVGGAAIYILLEASIWCFGTIAALTAYRAIGGTGHQALSAVASVSGLLALFALYAQTYWSKYRYRKARLESFGNFPLPQEAELTESGLILSSSGTVSTVPWRAIRSVKAIDAYVAITMSSLATWLVPRSAFASEEQCKQFLASLQSRIGA